MEHLAPGSPPRAGGEARAARLAVALAIACVALAVATGGAVHSAASAALCGLLLAAALSARGTFDPPPRAARGALVLALLACAVTLVPLPESVRAIVAPGPTRARSDLRALGVGGTWAPISVDVGATIGEALLWSGAAALLVLVRSGAGADRALRCAVALLLGLQALAAIDLFADTRVLPLTWIEDPWGVGQAALREGHPAGWLVNRNHAAALALLLVPLGVAAATRARSRGASRVAFVAAAATVLAAAGIVATRSRAGLLGLGIEVAGLAAFAAVRAGRGPRRVLLLALGVGALAAVPFAAVLLRGAFGEDRTGRPTLYAAVLRMIGDSPALGFGPGTFRAAFPAYQPASLAYSYSHAHSDPLEAATGGGVLGLAAVALLTLHGVRAAKEPGVDGGARALWAASVVGCAVVALVEFPLEIPAVRLAWLAVLFAGPRPFACDPTGTRPPSPAVPP